MVSTRAGLTLVAGWLCLIVAGCTATRTEVVVVVDSDIDTPAPLTSIDLTVTAPDGRTMQSAGARLGPDDVPLPRTLGLLHERGALGPFTVVARGFRGGSSAVVTRTARFFFQTGRTLVLQMDLLERCRGGALRRRRDLRHHGVPCDRRGAGRADALVGRRTVR